MRLIGRVLPTGCRRRRAGALAAAVLMALGMRVAAIDVQSFPKPPTLYAETAVLMDAATGQVLYGKSEHKKMFPASLTKIMTCLLTMQNGRYDDEVTITQEGSSWPVSATTHIALTEGEQLTLEQLTYAMMVQSANDAANSIALQLSGSVPMFARTMNEKAVQIGANGTHFVNPNGLPNDDHYTTAYDMALITREAMTYAEFEKFAGTQKYELAPTNKNDQVRKLVNGNYMFSLTDTYDGAFAGKTGWTEDAGHTLMTIAERDGVTLICVVMKSDGVVDAQFKDSTALFDYGFDNFRRVTLSGERFPVQQLEYSGEDDQPLHGRIYPASEQMQVLLPVGVSEDDLQIVTIVPDPLREEYLSRVRVEARVPEVAGEIMNRVAGSFEVEIRPYDPVVEETMVEPKRAPINWGLLIKLAGITLLALLVVGILLLLATRKMIRIYYSTLLRARCKHTYLTPADTYYLATHIIEEDELLELRAQYDKEKHFYGVSRADLQILHEARKRTAQAKKRHRALAKLVKEREKAWEPEPEEEQPFNVVQARISDDGRSRPARREAFRTSDSQPTVKSPAFRSVAPTMTRKKQPDELPENWFRRRPPDDEE